MTMDLPDLPDFGQQWSMKETPLYVCPICFKPIFVEARGGPHPSPGDHETGPHVAKAYGLEDAK